MPYIVDGNNLAGVLPGASGARDRRTVVERLVAWGRGRRVVVVFDGHDDADLPRNYGHVDVRFSGGSTADAVISREIRRDPRSWRVVTNDRTLAATCRDAGAEVVPSSRLAKQLGQGGESSNRPDSDEAVDVDDWAAWFERGGG